MWNKAVTRSLRYTYTWIESFQNSYPHTSLRISLSSELHPFNAKMLDHIKIASENVMVPTTPENRPIEEISQRMRSKPNGVHSLRRATYLVFMGWLAAIWIFSSAYEQTSRSGNIPSKLCKISACWKCYNDVIGYSWHFVGWYGVYKQLKMTYTISTLASYTSSIWPQ